MNKTGKRIVFLSVAVVILACSAPPASALTPTREQVQQGWEQRFQDLDKNRDGKVSWAEFLAFHGADSPPRRQFLEYEFRKYDKNGDGFITLEEHRAPVSLEDEFRGLDKNRDGRVSQNEFLQGVRLFQRLDLNHDGFITLDEYVKAYRHRQTGR